MARGGLTDSIGFMEGREASFLRARLEDLIGPERVLAEPAILIHGSRAPLEVRPADERQVADVLRLAADEGLGVCIAGGGTKLGWGGRPVRFDLLLSTHDLRSVCEVDADDLTVAVSAGVPVAEAEAQAREAGRILPLDGGRPENATIGGVVATGDQGARGAGYGAVRDLVLGVKATLADGSSVRFGGRTMKNVAGYDMTKLFVGSFGILGVVTEVNFRLLPRFDSQALLLLPLRSLAEGQQISAQILASHLQPLALEAVSPALMQAMALAEPEPPTEGPEFLLSFRESADEDGVHLLAAFAGHRAAVERSVREVRGCRAVRQMDVLWDGEASSALDTLRRYTATTHDGTGGLVVKARGSVPIASAWKVAEAARHLTMEAELILAYRINAARGLLDLWAGVGGGPEGAKSPATAPTAASNELTDWAAGVRQACSAAGGQLSITDGLAHLRPSLEAWDEVGSCIGLVKGIKERFDRHLVLNPGRFLGGI